MEGGIITAYVPLSCELQTPVPSNSSVALLGADMLNKNAWVNMSVSEQ